MSILDIVGIIIATAPLAVMLLMIISFVHGLYRYIVSRDKQYLKHMSGMTIGFIAFWIIMFVLTTGSSGTGRIYLRNNPTAPDISAGASTIKWYKNKYNEITAKT